MHGERNDSRNRSLYHMLLFAEQSDIRLRCLSQGPF